MPLDKSAIATCLVINSPIQIEKYLYTLTEQSV